MASSTAQRRPGVPVSLWVILDNGNDFGGMRRVCYVAPSADRAAEILRAEEAGGDTELMAREVQAIFPGDRFYLLSDPQRAEDFRPAGPLDLPARLESMRAASPEPSPALRRYRGREEALGAMAARNRRAMADLKRFGRCDWWYVVEVARPLRLRLGAMLGPHRFGGLVVEDSRYRPARLVTPSADEALRIAGRQNEQARREGD